MYGSRDVVVFGPPVPSLVHWGRSADADLVYRTLVVFGPGRVTELGRELGLPAKRVASALEELVSVGAVTARTAGPRRQTVWMAHPPAEVIATLRHQPAFSTAPADRSGTRLRESLVDGAVSRHLRTRALTRARLAELNAVSSHEHLAMNPELVFDPESARSAVPMDRMALRRGVRMRILGVHAPAPDPLEPYGRTAAEPQPDYRSAPTVPMKLIIIDRKIALFPVDPDNLERGYLEITQQPVVTALASLFEQHWQTAQDPRELAIPRTAFTTREHALIRLLADGYTDTSAARRLHIGLRTVSTTMRTLMDRFGVDNRFQLGLVLGALGAAETPTTESGEQED